LVARSVARRIAHGGGHARGLHGGSDVVHAQDRRALQDGRCQSRQAASERW